MRKKCFFRGDNPKKKVIFVLHAQVRAQANYFPIPSPIRKPFTRCRKLVHFQSNHGNEMYSESHKNDVCDSKNPQALNASK
jgi:hypothetical protein